MRPFVNDFPALPGAYYAELLDDVATNRSGLRESSFAALRKYYRSIADKRAMWPFYSYNWRRRTGPMVRLLMSLPHRDRPWRILDAGCGVGTESILWSLLREDLEIVGVDISQERLAVARERLEIYSQRAGRTLSVEFLRDDIFNVLRDGVYDIVWTMEAISHIDPAEAFLTAAAEASVRPGWLVISDSNLLNPAMAWRIFNLRRKGIAHTYKMLETGEVVSYAEERLFSPVVLSRLLKQLDYDQVSEQMSVFLPPVLARLPKLFPIAVGLDVMLNQLPIIRFLGGIYTIVAQKK